RLDRRSPRRLLDDARLAILESEQFADHLFSGLVLPDYSNETLRRAQGSDITGHISRPAQHRALFPHRKHGNGGLGRNPSHVAVNKPVEHDVAGAKYADRGIFLRKSSAFGVA